MQSIFPLLSQIQTPHDLRAMPKSALPQIAEELRQFLIQTLNQCGGHFGANLGVVELTLALHYVFDTPEDRLVWDVGHQAYAHKVLTGRRELLHTIRKTAGLAPFPARSESAYDAFGVGHSSTSISAALGMAIAAQAQHDPRQAVAIIGDGGLTGGMAFEALNHAGALDANLLVILNDNKMSISENVGALTNYFARILSGKVYSHLREGSKKILSNVPSIKAFAKRTETHVKGMITPGTLFEELGFHYFGPIDGHDLDTLLPTLQNLKALKGPRLLHIITAKGKGYSLAEADPIEYHAVKPGFLDVVSESVPSNATAPTYSEIFGQWLCDVAAQDSKLMAITPAMCEGSGMVDFAKQYPDRYFDVGIAEQHALTLAAGMACEGLKPVVAIYSTFLQRGYDQLIHDVALQNLDVTLAVDRAGIVGGDGATHHGYFDLSYLRHIPNLVIFAPSDENECRQMLYTAYMYPGPTVVRYPRGKGPGVAMDASLQILPIGKAEIKNRHSREGENPSKKIALLAFGSMVPRALKVAETLNATVVNMRYVKPLDEEMIAQMAETHDTLVTLEENTVAGGAGGAVNEWLTAHHYKTLVLNLGLPDRFIEQGDPDALLAECGLDAAGILSAIQRWL